MAAVAAATTALKEAPSIAHRLSRLQSSPATSSLLAATSIPELSAAVSALPLSKLKADELVTVLCACSRARLEDREVWRPVSQLLLPRLVDADGRSLAAVANAYAVVRIRNEPMLNQIAARSSTLVAGGADLQVHSVLFLLETLQRFEFQDGRHGVFSLIEEWLARYTDQMSMYDIAKALGSLARLRHAGKGLLAAAKPRTVELAGELLQSRGGHVDGSVAKEESSQATRHITMLLSAYARLSERDEVVLEALTRAIPRPAPAAYLASLVKTLAVQLKPPPPSLRKVVEASLPAGASNLEVHDLAIIVPALPLIPGLRASYRSLGQSVFGACLVAPLSRFRPRPLVGVIRSALALGYADVDFWVLALREAERSILGDLREGTSRWETDDLAGVALLAARILASGGKIAEGRPSSSDEEREQDPALQATTPAAKKLVHAALDAAKVRCADFTPRALGVLTVALVKAKVDDGGLFALIAHRASQLLSKNPDSFGSRDVAQLLVGFARFRYRDEGLLLDLAGCAETGMASYDSVAREIVLWSFSELGGIPGSHPGLREALLEYELAQGRKSDRAQPHFESMEVLPADA